MTNKIFITGPHSVEKLDIAKYLSEINDNLSIGNRFTNDPEYKDSGEDNYIYYLSTQSIDLTYKNNFVLFVDTNNYISTGITMDSYYNNDIFVMELNEFNNISDNIFKSEKGRSADALTRAIELNKMFEDKEVDAIICAAGGEFLVEILPYIKFENIVKKWEELFK